MSDIIRLLPDAIANQIAAGEVIQRPASAVKELLENAIDAGSTKIQLIIKNAGKTLIQVIDNGSGMSETDARLCFERHATSKIQEAKDLFAIRTLGFRGEAMASIAAIAQVELKTRLHGEALGIRVLIEGSKVKIHEPCQCPAGTSLAIKNLFFNVPARRNFLKSNPVETRHIVDEFQRVAFANPKIAFSLHHNEVEIFRLPAAKLRRRVVGILGSNFNERLVPIEEGTDFLRIYGFVGKPQYARKSRGEQYFFVNERFIKSSYLNHAVVTAYEGLLSDKNYPLYVIFIDIDPARIDVNVHPTKQEIKFDDEKVIYTFINAAVKRALGVYNVMPTLDFEQNISADFLQAMSRPAQKQGSKEAKQQRSEEVEQYSPSNFQQTNSQANQFTSKPARKQSSSATSQFSNKSTNQQTNKPVNWQALYQTEEVNLSPEQIQTITIESKLNQQSTLEIGETEKEGQQALTQIHYRYILSQIKSGFILIDQQLAHERILFERYNHQLEKQKGVSQKLLFPQTITLPPADALLLKEILADVNALGYDVQEFGQNTFVVHGIPSDLSMLAKKGNEQQIIESLLEQYQANLQELKIDKRSSLARSMAYNMAIKRGQSLSVEEMKALADQLFACEMPYVAPNGQPTFITQKLDALEKQFERKN